MAVAVLLIAAGCASPGRTVEPAPLASSPSPMAASEGPRAPERIGEALVVARPPQPVLQPRIGVPLVDDHCVDRDLPAPGASDPVLTVLDRSYAVAATDEPTDLVAASAAGFTGASGARLVREVMVDDLAAMRAAWEAAGLSISIDSAFRSHAAQAATFDTWIARLGLDGAIARTARPGHSEHQLGTAIDVSSPGWSGRFGDWAAETAEGAWMAEHAWEYGFVMSYPAGLEHETCFSYEPWHYRWIGREPAEDQHRSGISLRRFLERYAVP